MFVLIFGTTLVLFSTFLYRGFVRSHQEEFDAALYNHAVDVADAIDFTFLGQLIVQKDLLADGKKVFPFSLGQSLIQIRKVDGTVILSSKRLSGNRLPLTSKDLASMSRHGVSFQTVKNIDKDPKNRPATTNYRLLSYMISRPPYPLLVLQIAAPMTFLENERRDILSLLFILIPLVLVFAAIGGLLTSRGAMAPVQRIIKSARAIQASELSVRVPVPEEIELRELALTLNDLLARLQQAFESQERFIADASHQLKTPLAILRGELDVMKRRPRSPEEWEDFLDSASQEIEHLTRMVDDLLLLARVDAGSGSLTFQKVRLDEVLLESISRLDYFAREKQLNLVFNIDDKGEDGASSSDFEVHGDFELLRSLFHNLIENAIKYSPPESAVRVTLTCQSEWSEVHVSDEGPGISEQDLPHVFDRFHRVQSQSAKVSGLGLGLSIAQKIAHAHGAELLAQSRLGHGSEFTFRIKNF